ncbi:MAG TPA: sortase [Actinobacteria bacterium]|nr:sortase [Actinomycetota bacterium]
MTEKSENNKAEETENKKRPSRARFLTYVGANIVGAVLILVGISLLFWVGRPYATLYLSSSTIEALEVKAQEGPRTLDNRIIIPAVLVDAPIIEGFTEEALKTGAGHVVDSASPGEKGNVILAGHNYAYFVKGDQNLFSLLHLIKKGTPIYVFWGGKKYTYRSTRKWTVDRDNPSIFDETKGPMLTLIASASSWDSVTISSTRRLLVRAVPFDSK